MTKFEPHNRKSGVDVLRVEQDNTDVAPRAGFTMPDGSPAMRGGPIPELSKIRANFPFLSIMKIPRSITVVCTDADTPYVLDIPDKAVIGTFQSTSDFYVSFGGKAKSVGSDMQEGQLVNPVYSWFYIGNKRQLSVISPTAGAVVQLHYHIMDN
jgi:hypothetical protein